MTSEYTPDEDLAKTAWHQYATAADASRARLRGDDENPSDEFDRFVARVKAEAWDEGAEHAWRSTGEGFNGEYVGGHGTHDGAISFRQIRAEDDRDDNPYREEAGQ